MTDLSADNQTDQLPLVLIVDDCPAVHRLLQARLRSEAVRIMSAMDGREALDKADVFNPDLILLDLSLPGMDGYEVLRSLKNKSSTHEIPVLIVSGKRDPEDKVTAFDLGAVDFVCKPFEMAELRARIRVALRMQRLVRMLAQRAQIDGLTGLSNRTQFDRRWHEEFERASRSGHPLSLAMIDLDEFKSINDTYGHPAGDAVLSGIAQMVQRAVRVSDIPCRFGGEEFAIILPEIGSAHAELLCERIRKTAEAMEWPRHPARRVTLSVGVAGSDTVSGHRPEDFIEHADKHLYTAKRSGRNRVVSGDLGTGPVRIAS